jgi:hypothetical protein
MRKMEWVKEKTFEGWTCSECGWLFPNPRLHVTDSKADESQILEELNQLARDSFERHICNVHPKTPSTQN